MVKERTKTLLEELEHREEMLFKMVSGIRLDLDKQVVQIRNIDEILTRILRVEEKALSNDRDGWERT